MDIQSLIEPELDDLIRIRHELHRHPELQFDLPWTSGFVRDELARLGIEHASGLAGGCGVLGYLPATEPGSGSAVALRADMDALPIEEQTGLEYASRNPGRMHACGHDGHTTILLGVARVLSRLTHRPNPVLLIFQPAEEGGAGGDHMCKEGVLDGSVLGPSASRIFGLHGWPDLELGCVATRPGPLLAAADQWSAAITGTQSHGASPHLGHDPIVAAAACVSALQTIVARGVNPTEPAVVTVGTIHGGTARNIIPQAVTITGTARSLTPETRDLLKRRLFEVLENTAMAHGCSANVVWEDGYPVTVNDPAMAEHVLAVAREELGADRVQIVPEPTMGGEDFAFYAQHIPACFYYLGMCPPQREAYPSLHQPDYDFNDAAIGTGMALMCRLALETMETHHHDR
jgi:amidohydrolase